MAINKKSLVTKAPAKNSAAAKSKATASKPVAPGKMVPARLARTGLQVSKATIMTGVTRF